jgi:uncharacterized membrane protein (GlpM family)
MDDRNNIYTHTSKLDLLPTFIIIAVYLVIKEEMMGALTRPSRV